MSGVRVPPGPPEGHCSNPRHHRFKISTQRPAPSWRAAIVCTPGPKNALKAAYRTFRVADGPVVAGYAAERSVSRLNRGMGNSSRGLRGLVMIRHCGTAWSATGRRDSTRELVISLLSYGLSPARPPTWTCSKVGGRTDDDSSRSGACGRYPHWWTRSTRSSSWTRSICTGGPRS